MEALEAFMEEGVDDVGLALADVWGGYYYYFHLLDDVDISR